MSEEEPVEAEVDLVEEVDSVEEEEVGLVAEDQGLAVEVVQASSRLPTQSLSVQVEVLKGTAAANLKTLGIDLIS